MSLEGSSVQGLPLSWVLLGGTQTLRDGDQGRSSGHWGHSPFKRRVGPQILSPPHSHPFSRKEVWSLSHHTVSGWGLSVPLRDLPHCDQMKLSLFINWWSWVFCLSDGKLTLYLNRGCQTKTLPFFLWRRCIASLVDIMRAGTSTALTDGRSLWL